MNGEKMDRIEALEEKAAHLIRALEDMSDVVTRQGREIDRLTRIVGLLAEREAGREAGGEGAPEADVRPPHW
jgi:SlyX protein